MIAVTFALPNESSSFRKFLLPRNNEVAVLHTGVGAKMARTRLESFLAERNFSLLISAGFAGGLEPSLGVGDLLLAENFSDPQLFAFAQELLVARCGKLLTIDHVLDSAEERARVAREQNALAVDMETEAIAEVCAQKRLPLLSLRAISDTAAAPFPVPRAVLFDLTRQKTNFFALAKYLARHPTSLGRMRRFAAQIHDARASLTNALAILARELSSQNFA